MDQDREIWNEAKKQYFRYFRFWMIGAAVLLVVAVVVTVGRAVANNRPRGNQKAPAERVYDYADVLTNEEERQLREQIARLEKKAHADFVLVTLNQPMGFDDDTWTQSMVTRADDLYENVDNDYASYGWDKPYGDGALLLDNWYEDEQGSQKGAWLSTSGKMERIIGAYQEGRVFDAMDVYIDSSPYRAYSAALAKLAEYGEESAHESGEVASMMLGSVAIATIVAVIYALVNLKQSKARRTTSATTYVPEGKTVLNVKTDDFLRKNVTRRRIESSSGGGGGSHHSGGGGSYGSHSSSSGHSHGGGGRRR